MRKITIGTAAFGIPYGINKNKNAVTSKEIKKIISLARKNYIHSYDTSPSYGISENILGKELYDIDIVSSKILKIKKNKITKDDILKIDECFETTRLNLKKNNLDILYIHHPEDLIAEGSEYLYEWLNNKKLENKINKIGISVFFEKDLECIISKYKIDTVQIPLNLFDQRFLNSGLIDDLYSKNIDINVRSIFLQGLLMKEFDSLPPYFRNFTKEFNQLKKISKEYNQSIMNIALLFVLNIKKINKLIIGVKIEQQLQEIIDIFKINIYLKNTDILSSSNINLIYPTLWK